MRIMPLVTAMAMASTIFSPLSVTAVGDTSIEAETVYVDPGTDSADVAISISGNTGIDGIHFEVIFDEAQLELTEVTDQKLFKGSQLTFGAKYTSPYVVSWYNADSSMSITSSTDNGTIAILHFQILDTASFDSADVKIHVVEKGTFRITDVENYIEEQVAVQAKDGGIKVKTSSTETNSITTTTNTISSTTTESTTFTSLSTKPIISTTNSTQLTSKTTDTYTTIVATPPYSGVLFGDVNLDGNVTNKDVSLLSDFLQGIVQFSSYQIANADVYIADNYSSPINEDIDAFDMYYLRGYVLGEIISLPVFAKPGDTIPAETTTTSTTRPTTTTSTTTATSTTRPTTTTSTTTATSTTRPTTTTSTTTATSTTRPTTTTSTTTSTSTTRPTTTTSTTRPTTTTSTTSTTTTTSTTRPTTTTSTTITTTATVSSTEQTDWSDTLYGDVNLDGTVNSLDADMITKWLKDPVANPLSSLQLHNANVYLPNDNVVNDADAWAILQYDSGKFPSLPYDPSLSNPFGTSPQTTTSSTTIPSKTTTVTPFSKGDVNGDGIINSKDAAKILIAAAMIGTGGKSGLNPEEGAAADVNGDGTINAKDANIVLRYAAAVGTGQKVSIKDFI